MWAPNGAHNSGCLIGQARLGYAKVPNQLDYRAMGAVNDSTKLLMMYESPSEGIEPSTIRLKA